MIPMKKIFFCITMTVVLGIGNIQNSNAQTTILLNKPVGSITKVMTVDDLYKRVSCRTGGFDCIYRFYGYFYGNGMNPSPGFYTVGNDLYYSPNDTIPFRDTLLEYYHQAVKTTNECEGYACDSWYPRESNYLIVYGNAYWDSTFSAGPLNAVEHQVNVVIFSPDASQHYQPSTLGHNFYNSTADSVQIFDWAIQATPPIPIDITVKRNQVIIDTIKSFPMEKQISVNYTVSTTALTTNYARTYPGTITFRVKTRSYDSVFSKPVTIYLDGDSKSNVTDLDTAKNFLQIYPNPSTGRIKVLLNATDKEVSELAVYDILGNKIITFGDENISHGAIEYNITLPAGIFYLRCVRGDGVITKKIIVE